MKKIITSITTLLLAFAMVLSLTGCSETKKAETAVNNTFKALKELDFETASTYINVDEIMKSDDSDETLDLDSNLLMKNLFGKLEHEIISSEKTDNNTVVVKTKITAIDMKPVLAEYLGKAMQYAFANAFADPKPSEEEIKEKMAEMFVECVSKEDLATVTNEVDIKVVNVDNKWKIESDNILFDALIGGLAKAAEELGNSLNSAE